MKSIFCCVTLIAFFSVTNNSLAQTSEAGQPYSAPPYWLDSFTHDDSSVSRVLVFRSTAGVSYRVQSSHDLLSWSDEQTFYGLGQEIAFPMVRTAAPSAPQPQGPPSNEVRPKYASLMMRAATSGGIVLSWRSLDHEMPVEHHLSGLVLGSAWDSYLFYTRRFDNFYFSLGHSSATAVPKVNSILANTDAAMVASFVAHFSAMNDDVADHVARARLQPVSIAPVDANTRKFFRIIADWSLDSDFDLSPDWLEFMAMFGQNGMSPVSTYMDADGNAYEITANPFGDALTSEGEVAGKVQDLDKDGTPDVDDVSPAESMLNWKRGSYRYAMFPVSIPDLPEELDRRALQTNALGQVLFRHSVWRNGVHTPLSKSGLVWGQSLAMNDNGEVLGNATIIDGLTTTQRVISTSYVHGMCWWTAADTPPTMIKSLSPLGDNVFAQMTEKHYSAGIRGEDIFGEAGRFCAPGGKYLTFDNQSSHPEEAAPAMALWSRNAAGQYSYQEIETGYHFLKDPIAPWKFPDDNGNTEVQGKQLKALVSKFVAMPYGVNIACSHSSLGSQTHFSYLGSPWKKVSRVETAKDFSHIGIGITVDNQVWMNNGELPMEKVAYKDLPAGQAWQNYQLLDLSHFGHLLAAKEAPASSSGSEPAVAAAHSEVALGYPFSLKDDLPATGVDNLSQSITFSGNEKDGFQEKLWVMAPQGTWLHPQQGPQPCENRFQIIAPLGDLTAEFTLDNATSNSYEIIGTPRSFNFRGTGNSTTEGNINISMGGNTSLSYPIGVKSMKRRTVRLHIYRCQHSATITPGVDDPYPYDIAKLTAYLDEIFGKQINVHFSITESTLMAGQNGNAMPLYPTILQDDETYISSETINTVIAPLPFPENADIRVFALGHKISASGIGASGMTPEKQNSIYLDPMRYMENSPDDRAEYAMRTLAHEAGHVFCGSGHPDNGDGAARLPGTDHTKRLMCSGSNTTSSSHLLVKREWDKAEEWLKNRKRGDN